MEKDRSNPFHQLAKFSNEILIFTGAGMSMQSAGILDATPLDLPELAARLLRYSDLDLIHGEQAKTSIRRWMKTGGNEEALQKVMERVLETELLLTDYACWDAVFACGRPVITENYDLHAAKALFRRINRRECASLTELQSVMLTWESSETEIRRFLLGDLPDKVLYREGSLLQAGPNSRFQQSGNWILGYRYSQAAASPTLELINLHLKRYPVLMIGIHGAVATTVIRQKMVEIAIAVKGKKPVIELFRVVREGIAQVPLVRDLPCKDYSRANFLRTLDTIKKSLNPWFSIPMWS